MTNGERIEGETILFYGKIIITNIVFVKWSPTMTNGERIEGETLLFYGNKTCV
jgi:hypothetical protein